MSAPARCRPALVSMSSASRASPPSSVIGIGTRCELAVEIVELDQHAPVLALLAAAAADHAQRMADRHVDRRVAVPDHLAHPVADDAIAARRLVGRLVFVGLVGLRRPRPSNLSLASFGLLPQLVERRRASGRAMYSSASLRTLPLRCRLPPPPTAARIISSASSPRCGCLRRHSRACPGFGHLPRPLASASRCSCVIAGERMRRIDQLAHHERVVGGRRRARGCRSTARPCR